MNYAQRDGVRLFKHSALQRAQSSVKSQNSRQAREMDDNYVLVRFKGNNSMWWDGKETDDTSSAYHTFTYPPRSMEPQQPLITPYPPGQVRGRAKKEKVEGSRGLRGSLVKVN